jgi:asparagine synthase (glutamine-hydrolysing)
MTREVRQPMQRGSINESQGFGLRRTGAELQTQGSGAAFLGYTLGDSDGVWVRWQWHAPRFELWSDRYGFYPVFYHSDAQSFGVSTSLVDLLRGGASRDLDDAAIAVFLRLGFYLGDDTPFKSVRAIPPGCRLTWSPSERGVASERAPGNGRSQPATRSEALRDYGRIFQCAVDALAPTGEDRVCVPLSGGRDSRHILYALVSGARKPTTCVTLKHFPPRANEDARIAAEVAAALGVAHVVLEPAREPIAAELRKNELTNFCADEHGWILELADFVRSHGYDVLYDGIAGDVLSAGLFLNERNLSLYRQGDLDELAETILGPEDDLSVELAPAYSRRWNRALALKRLRAELEKHVTSPNPIGQFYFWNRTRREIALSPWGLLGRNAQVFAPYLAAPVYDLLASLPAEYFLDHSFHTEAIRAQYPQYAHIPFENKDVPPTHQRLSNTARWTAQVARYCVFSSTSASYVQNRFLLRSIVKGLIDRNYGSRQLDHWTLPLYLEQLARLEAGAPAKL